MVVETYYYHRTLPITRVQNIMQNTAYLLHRAIQVFVGKKNKLISFNMCELCKTARALGSSEHPLDSEELAGEAALCLSQTGSSPSLVCKKQASPLASY